GTVRAARLDAKPRDRPRGRGRRPHSPSLVYGATMKTISIQQPWAAAVVLGRKDIENRSWPTRYRGPLLIHAGRSRAQVEALGRVELTRIVPTWHLPEMAFGAVIGIVTFFDCVPVEEAGDSEWAGGPWCWLLRDRRAFDRPVPLRGRLGLFEVDDD